MSAHPLNLRLWLAALALAGVARADSKLSATSPFAAPQMAGQASAPTQNAPLEFRGVMQSQEGMQFRIVDAAHKKGWFVKLNQRDPDTDFIVKQYDGNADPENVVVEQGGRTMTLALRTAKISSSGGPAGMPPPTGPAFPNVPAAVTNAVVVNPTPADEQKRLEAVAAEVQRRRQLREQAANGQPPAQPGQLQPAVQPAQPQASGPAVQNPVPR